VFGSSLEYGSPPPQDHLAMVFLHESVASVSAAAPRVARHSHPCAVGMKTDRIRTDITDIVFVFVFMSGFGFEYE
jgi:hypothetical protein